MTIGVSLAAPTKIKRGKKTANFLFSCHLWPLSHFNLGSIHDDDITAKFRVLTNQLVLLPFSPIVSPHSEDSRPAFQEIQGIPYSPDLKFIKKSKCYRKSRNGGITVARNPQTNDHFGTFKYGPLAPIFLSAQLWDTLRRSILHNRFELGTCVKSGGHLIRTLYSPWNKFTNSTQSRIFRVAMALIIFPSLQVSLASGIEKGKTAIPYTCRKLGLKLTNIVRPCLETEVDMSNESLCNMLKDYPSR